MNTDSIPHRVISAPETVDYDSVEHLIVWATDCNNPQRVYATLPDRLIVSFRGRTTKHTPMGINQWSVDTIADVEVWQRDGRDITLVGYAEVAYREDDPDEIRAAIDEAVSDARERIGR